MENILFLAALLFLFSSLQRRRKQRESHEKNLPRTGEAGEQREKEEKIEESASSPDQAEKKEPEAPPGSRSYEEFRKKLRKAWHMPEEAWEESAEEKEEMPLPPDLDAPPYEEKEPPRPAAEEPSAAPGKRTSPPEKAPSGGGRQGAAISGKEQGKAAPAALPSHGGWTEADVERWALYDAVLGEPRSRRPWTPPRRRPS